MPCQIVEITDKIRRQATLMLEAQHCSGVEHGLAMDGAGMEIGTGAETCVGVADKRARWEKNGLEMGR